MNLPFRRWGWLLIVGAAALGAAGFAMVRDRGPAIGYDDARSVVDRRCRECHSEKPTNRAFPIAPQGVLLDTPRQMKQYARRIETRVIRERTMPLANISSITDEERRVLSRWVEAGARVP